MNKIKSLFAWLWQKFRAFWPWYKGLYQGRAWYTKTLVALASCIVAFILYLGAVDINFLWLFGKSPGYFSGILDPQTSEASEIYSADGKLIGKYFNENRTPVEYDEVTPDFFKALVDTEDERFYKHIGIDPIGVFAAAKDALLHHNGARCFYHHTAAGEEHVPCTVAIFYRFAGQDSCTPPAHHQEQGVDHRG